MTDAKSWDTEGKRNKLYGRRWRKERGQFLSINRYCQFCRDAGKRTKATVVDHIIPHRGDEQVFWDQTNWQALCQPHHDGDKAVIEARGYSDRIGADGWPVDPLHPSHGGALDHGKGGAQDTDPPITLDLVLDQVGEPNPNLDDEPFVI